MSETPIEDHRIRGVIEIKNDLINLNARDDRNSKSVSSRNIQRNE